MRILLRFLFQCEQSDRDVLAIFPCRKGLFIQMVRCYSLFLRRVVSVGRKRDSEKRKHDADGKSAVIAVVHFDGASGYFCDLSDEKKSEAMGLTAFIGITGYGTGGGTETLQFFVA